MKKKILNLTKKPFIKNVIILSSGTAAAQTIGMLLSPVITRLYGPEAYGLMGTFTAIIQIVAPVAALTYPISIVLPKHDRDAKGLMRLSLMITILITIVVGLSVLLFHEQIVRLFQLEEIAPFLYLIPLIILSAGLLQVIEQWLIRTKQFGISAKATLFQAIMVNGGKVGFGFFHPVASVLIIFNALNQGLKAFLMLLFTRNTVKKTSSFTEKVPLKVLANKYRNFPLFRAPQIFLNGISQNLPVLMLTSFFGPASAGFYSISRTVLTVPSTLIGKSVGDVFYPRISEAANNNESLTTLIKKASLSLGIVGIFPFGIVILFGPWLFGFVFGSEWATAGEYARWISLWMFFMFMNQPSVKALLVMSAQSFHLKFTVITLVIRISILALGYFGFSSDLIAIALFGISGAVLSFLLIVLTIRRSRKFDQGIN